MIRSFSLVIAVLLARSGDASANPCLSDVTISGNAALVAAIESLLADRGIRTGTGLDPDCQVVRARVERRHGRYVVAIDQAEGALERPVTDLATAATVIESFVREDMSLPLLTGPGPSTARASSVGRIQPSAPTASVHLFAAAEMSLGSDETAWMGMQVGACLMLGRVCAAARLRAVSLVDGENEVWERTERETNELLLGIDVPLRIGPTLLSPGIAAGLGVTHTEADDDSAETTSGGLRADVHVALSIPLTRRLALDLSTALDLSQETYRDSDTSFPDEPLALLRFGAGIRYGGL